MNIKRLLIGGLIAGTMAFSSCGNDSKKISSSAAVPEDVLDEFYDTYPRATNVTWRMEEGLYKAHFRLYDSDMKATFTPDGDFVKADS